MKQLVWALLCRVRGHHFGSPVYRRGKFGGWVKQCSRCGKSVAVGMVADMAVSVSFSGTSMRDNLERLRNLAAGDD